MFGIDLTGGQKLQIGFTAVIFAIAGFLLLRSTRGPVDMTVNASGPVQRLVGIDPRLPVSAKNPVDPDRTTLVTTFGCHDGKLFVTEFPPERNLKAQFYFVADAHRNSYDFYKDPWTRVRAISDPCKRTITIAAYGATDHHPRQILGRADLTKDQLGSEKTARQTMLDEVTLMEEGAKTGNFHPEMYEKVLAALKAYKAVPGDPMKDPAKAKAAHQLIDLAMQYLDLVESEKAKSIDTYVAVVEGLLDASQKAKLVGVSKQLATRGMRMVRPGAG